MSGQISGFDGQPRSCSPSACRPRHSIPHHRQACFRQGRPPRWFFRRRDRIDAAAFKTSSSLGSWLLKRIRRNSNSAS